MGCPRQPLPKHHAAQYTRGVRCQRDKFGLANTTPARPRWLCRNQVLASDPVSLLPLPLRQSWPPCCQSSRRVSAPKPHCEQHGQHQLTPVLPVPVCRSHLTERRFSGGGRTSGRTTAGGEKDKQMALLQNPLSPLCPENRLGSAVGCPAVLQLQLPYTAAHRHCHQPVPRIANRAVSALCLMNPSAVSGSRAS